MNNKTSEVFNRNTLISPLAVNLSIHARKKMLNIFFSRFNPIKGMKILDIGVTSDSEEPSNYLEKTYPYLDDITCAGIQDCSELISMFPGIQFVQLIKDQPLPFVDKSFDVVYSNAVIEHVGSRKNQQDFIDEILRVGKNFFITTPNRWFPVEHHTHVPFLHFLPQKYFRKFLQYKGENFFSCEDNLNLCSIDDIKRFDFQENEINIEKIKIYGFTSNLCIYNLAK
jgi:SAM-dependent methyltransferase